MSISYKPFFKLLIDKEIKAAQLVKEGALSRSTMLKMKKGDYISLDVVDKLCKYLKCQPGDILEYIDK